MANSQFHKTNLTTAACLRCGLPMSKWRAFSICAVEPKGHIPPSSPLSDKEYLYQCNNCSYQQTTNDESLPIKCPKCTTGMMTIQGWVEEHGQKDS